STLRFALGGADRPDSQQLVDQLTIPARGRELKILFARKTIRITAARIDKPCLKVVIIGPCNLGKHGFSALWKDETARWKDGRHARIRFSSRRRRQRKKKPLLNNRLARQCSRHRSWLRFSHGWRPPRSSP